MKVKEKTKKNAGVLYRVDPKRLSIKLCYTSELGDEAIEYSTTTFESFSFERVKVRPEVPEQIGQLPACIDGVYFFATEEEAQEFVRRQIGM